MTFEFNHYSTPLLFGFAQGVIYAVLFFVRGWRQERLSDWLFGGLLIACVFNIWEYMLGFAGIELLWKELNFFPRNFSLLLPPLVYFYLKSQVNADFRFQWKDLKHAIPFFMHLIYRITVFAQGPDFVKYWETDMHFAYGINYLELGIDIVINVLYFYWAYRLYGAYQRWMPSHFSDTEVVSFKWFRNFLMAFFVSGIASWAMLAIDVWLELDFWHDWWDELFGVALIYYLAIEGYAQKQPHTLHFESAILGDVGSGQRETPKLEKVPASEIPQWKTRLERIMDEEKPWLEAELTLSTLAQRTGTAPSILSAVINGAFGKNFNDFVNEYRVEAVKKMLKDASKSHYSLLGIGLECGFNSKSTFNRVFKKMTGVAPGDFYKIQ